MRNRRRKHDWLNVALLVSLIAMVGAMSLVGWFFLWVTKGGSA